ncbi:unnamed protein product (macronuclear) [Paramecium tetraurelia]|uniref:Uncharacterized protein n=1 Tax=Paramecium tetraurelia TaxID=5888 RepID=A0D6T0_PARTE|nr:uncharacterized protein GSPATT00001788001 [Paramecium tetraurelia]CAK78747.1 unnamed protein product [Paramecium tetraurelia]|eukprot:XP_001446144.1 hypothetical protein (macronuclear) [Paramecium tetraurelia strain d4-2]
MGCTSTKLKYKRDLCLLNVPIQQGRNMCKEEGITSREYKKTSSQNRTQYQQQIIIEGSESPQKQEQNQ